MQIIIDIPEEVLSFVNENGFVSKEHIKMINDAFLYATPLPKGYSRLISERDIIKFLECSEYDDCTWKNCTECNRVKCIRLDNLYKIPAVLEADKEG